MKRQLKKVPHDDPWDSPCIIMASGPSLGFDNYADVELAKESGLKTIVINSTHDVAPWADVLYAGDTIWWKANYKNAPKSMEWWTCSKSAGTLFGCKYRARFIKPGYNSGANAIELAANVFKCPQIILLGFDMSVAHGVHHHADHKKSANPNASRCARWKPQFKSARDRSPDSQIINCSRYSEIPYFEKMSLQDALSYISC